MKPRHETKRIGIWIRVSTEDQAHGESPEHHEKRARLYAQANGWEVCEVYHLEGVSGKSVFGHPETSRMLADIQRGHICGLIFSKLARLARNTRELLDFAEIFEHNRAHLISLQEAIDTSTSAGRLFYTMLAAMAQWEREEISDRVAASVPIRAKLGKPLGGGPTFGYEWKDRKLVPNPQEAPVRRLVYELFMEYRRLKTVARLLNERGYRTRKGNLFRDGIIRRLITDPTAKGLRRANYTTRRGNVAKWEFKPETDWVHHEVPAIVSVELWEQCNQLLLERTTKKPRPGKRAAHLLAGYTFCHCGNKMYVPSNTPKYVCQKCRIKIPIIDLEAIYAEQLKGFSLSEEELQEQIRANDSILTDRQKQLDLLKVEEVKLRREMDSVFRLYVERKITSDGFADRYGPMEQRARELADEIPRLEAEVDYRKISLMSADQIMAEARNLHALWPSLPFQEKRRLVENITEKITVGREEIAVDLFYFPSPEIMANRLQNPIVLSLQCRATSRA